MLKSRTIDVLDAEDRLAAVRREHPARKRRGFELRRELLLLLIHQLQTRALEEQLRERIPVEKVLPMGPDDEEGEAGERLRGLDVVDHVLDPSARLSDVRRGHVEHHGEVLEEEWVGLGTKLLASPEEGGFGLFVGLLGTLGPDAAIGANLIYAASSIDASVLIDAVAKFRRNLQERAGGVDVGRRARKC